jgi:hypothetical protein
MISPHIIIAKVPADSGTWTETITATDSSNRTVTTVVPFVVSDWIAYQDYPVGYVQLGAPVNATITAQKSGVLTDVAGLTIRWLDQGMITTTSSIVGTMADVTSHPSAGVYRVAIPTAQGLSVGSEYHSTLRILDASGTILASDYHADIMIINNPALAPKNFAVEKILTSIPPAPETYDLKFTWDQSANASGYNLYRSQSKFSTLYDDSCTIAQVQDGDRAAGNCEKTIHMDTDATDDTTHWVQQAALTSGGTRTYTVKNAQNLPGSEYFFILRANNGAIESGLSSMTFVNKLNFAYNAADGASNVNWISIPYVADFYTNAASTLMTASLIQASIVVRDVEIGTGINTNQKIDRVSLWDPVSQGIIGNYAYRAGGAFNRWMGTDFMIAPGSGIFLETSGNTPTFNWTTVGSDDQNPIVFAYNGSGATNVNWVSLPYSGMYTNASDIVTDIEGGIGANTDQKIDRISLWDPVSQGIVGNYAYRAGGAFNRWMGNNFVITPGSGVFIEMSGNTPTFTWTPALLVNPNQ